MKIQAVIAFGALGVVALAVGKWQGIALRMNGKVVSGRVRVIDGEAWVPVRDLAKSQGLAVQPTSKAQIDLVEAGGANQVDGLRGRIGDTVFGSGWRLTVRSFERVDRYHIASHTSTDYAIYSPIAELQDGTFTPKPGYALYVADCTVKNGTQKDEQFEWSAADNKTAVADSSGSNHPWIVFDIPSPAFVSKPVLPGAAIDFKICFAVESNATPQDLIVTLKSLSQKGGRDARIVLGPVEKGG